MRRTACWVACSAFLASALAAAPARAYRTAADDLGVEGPVLVARERLEIRVGRSTIPGLGADTLMAAARLAAAAWEVGCTPLVLDLAGIAMADASPTDEITTIEVVLAGWRERGYAADRAAITEARYVETEWGWEIADADVLVNGDTIDWSARGAPDLRSVLVHELGHVLGIAHPCEHEGDGDVPLCEPEHAERSVMYPDHAPDAYSLRAEDVEAVCTLYPRRECAAASCGPGTVCEVDRCVPVCASGELCPSGVCAMGADLEGRCIAGRSEGAPCEVGNDCDSRLCLTSMHAGSYCTRACAGDAECPGAQACREVEGWRVCAPRAAPPAQSCAVSGGAASPPGWIVVLSLALVAQAGRRHGRRAR